MKRILTFIIILVFFIYLAESFNSWYFSDFFRVVFFDVGQGDSILIVTPNGKTILVDGGPDKKILRSLGRALPFWQRRIDLLVITHAHDDHIAGLVELNRRYKVKNILYNNLNFETPVTKSLVQMFKNNKNKIIVAQEGTSFKFDNNCFLSVLSAAKEIQKNDNDYSIVSMFDCLGRKVLLTGDAGVAIEKKLLMKDINVRADIFKVAHHGSLSASSEDFLRSINPKIVVISVGAKNKFNHPASLVLNKLAEMPVDTYRTDINGQIEFLANNKLIILKK